jgi:N-acetylglucosaminyldiphosphoundecaprenol N-acetyl-beta-D-mannosaminyltransferase
MPEVAAEAATRLAGSPGVEIVGVLSPEPGELRDPAYTARAIETINRSGARILAVALGAPKQEVWLADHASELTVRVGLGIGATLDFIAGARRRAPRWMQRIGLEWLFRLFAEPVRLGKRYLVRDPVFGAWVLKAFVRTRVFRRPARAEV